MKNNLIGKIFPIIKCIFFSQNRLVGIITVMSVPHTRRRRQFNTLPPSFHRWRRPGHKTSWKTGGQQWKWPKPWPKLTETNWKVQCLLSTAICCNGDYKFKNRQEKDPASSIRLFMGLNAIHAKLVVSGSRSGDHTLPLA